MEGLVLEKGLRIDSFDSDLLEGFDPENPGNEEPLNSRFMVRPFVWPANKKPESAKYFDPNSVENFPGIPFQIKGKDGKQISESDLAELAMVKERLSKLLLGEDMSGSGNGVQTALAISNAVTNLSASVFGQLWRLEPLSQLKKSMWKRELDCVLCVTDYIVVLTPSWHTYPDGSRVEIMSSGPRSDLAANLPALRQLDSMLLEILDCFVDTEFWYVEKGLESPKSDVEVSRMSIQNQEERWWLPVPHVPSCGLGDVTRRMLQNKRDCANQILKAVTAINNMTLADMEVPESYFDCLPKNAKDCLGERMYRYIASHRFSSERLVAALGISSDHQALEIANQVEASVFIFRRRTNFKDLKRYNSQLSSKNSWEMVKEFAVDGHKLDILAGRAESLLLCLKQRFPGLPQTTLDTIKIQHNKDIGKSILESYSRVLESLAFNIIARVDDVLYVDDSFRQSDEKKESFLSKVCAANNSSVPPSNPNKKTLVAKKTTLMSHIPSLQSSNSDDFQI